MSQATIQTSLLRMLFLCAVTLCCARCMLTPTDGQRVARASDPIAFSGLHLDPAQPITLEAFNFGAARWEPLGVTSSTSSPTAVGDGPMYAWSVNQTLPARFWDPGSRGRGARARVRAHGQLASGGNADLISLSADWGACVGAIEPLTRAAIYSQCHAPNSPVAEISTSDYVPPVWGVADLHTHPAVHRAFLGDGLFWGSPGSTLASRPEVDMPPCRADTHVASDDLVGTPMRQAVMAQIDRIGGGPHTPHGPPDWSSWPHALSVEHQQMHITAIRRAYEGGVRLMFASAMDNQTLSMMWHRNYDFYGNPRPAFRATYDLESAKRQISFIRDLVGRNIAWMQIVQTPAEARAVIHSGRMAVVLSLEMDTLTLAQIRELRGLGVRHVIPVHFADNSFGGTALNGAGGSPLGDENIFNTANWFMNGRFFSIEGDSLIRYRLGRPLKLHYHANDLIKGGAVEPVPVTDAEYVALGYARVIQGHRNARHANLPQIRELMRLGLMVDVAHMGQNTMSDVLGEASARSYPIMNSHTGLRADGALGLDERAMLESQAATIARLGGVIGMGTATRSEGGRVLEAWISDYSRMRTLLGGRGVALGTDLNGMQSQLTSTTVPSRYPLDVAARRAPEWARSSAPVLSQYRVGSRSYEGNRDGLAHYGMLPELFQALDSVPADPGTGRPSGASVVDALFSSAEDVVSYWEGVELAAARL